MNHVMLDLETLGTRPGSVILSIGAVAFDHRQGLGEEFYVVIDRASCEAAGLTVDRDTLAWWERQSPEARTVLTQAGIPLNEALDKFTAYLSQFKDVRVWGCGATFDNVLISSAYAALGKRQPWRYINDRCYRTLKNLMPAVAMEREGVFHNALADAKSQASHAIRILAVLAK